LEEELMSIDENEYNKNLKSLLDKEIIMPFEKPFLNR
jgi:hypothetical protein